MGMIQRFFGRSPFSLVLEHTRKVHSCVLLLRPLAEALLKEDYEGIKKLHHEMSQTEYEADQIKANVREAMSSVYMLSVGRYEFLKFLTYQDNVADAAEDFAVVLRIRRTRMPEALQEDFLAFVEQVVRVSEHLLNLCEELSVLAESAFVGQEAKKFFENIEEIGQEEWKADKLQRVFSTRAYDMEGEIDPITLMFLDKYCHTLSSIANSAEKTAKYLRQIIGSRK